MLDPDEGRYAEIPREMLVRGDFVTPTLNGVLYFEKPPLYYWSVALAFKLFGLTEWAARSVSALSAIGTVLLVYALGRRMFGARAGLLGAVVLSTTVFWAGMARQNIIDIQFSFLLFAALTLWWFGRSEQLPSRQTAYFLGFWAALALAVLSKGPVSAVLIGAAVFFHALINKQWQDLKMMRWLPGVSLLLLITAPWFIAIARAQPDFNHFFWYGQHIGRFLGQGENREHVEGVTWFVQLLPAIFFPWSLFVPAAIHLGWRSLRYGRGERHDAVIYLLGFALFVLLFFSVSASKLITYMLPLLPPVTLLLGVFFDRLLRRASQPWSITLVIGSLLLSAILVIGGIVFLLRGASLLHRLDAGITPMWAYGVGIMLFVWGVVLLVMTKQRRSRRMLMLVAGGSIMLQSAVYNLAPVILRNFACKPLLDTIRPGLQAGGKLVIYGHPTLCSANFYQRTRLVVVGEPGELKFGMEHAAALERTLWFQNANGPIHALLNQPTPLYGLVESTKQARKIVAQSGGQWILIDSNARRAMIGNHAAAALTPSMSQTIISLH